MLDSSYQGVKRLFVLVYDNSANDWVFIDSFKKYFFLRVKIENCNIEIDGKKIYDQPINDLMTQLSNTTKSEKHQQGKVMITQLLVCWILRILKKNYKLIAADLSKQKSLNADSRVIQQTIFTGKIKATKDNTRVTIYYILEQSRETENARTY